MIPCPGKTVCDITISSLSTKYKMKFHLGNFVCLFFLFFCNRMGLISVSGQKALCNRAIWWNVSVLSGAVSNDHRS